MNDALLLNADWTPVRIVDWQRAVCLLLDERATLVRDYPDRQIHSPRVCLPWPAVITLRTYQPHRTKVRFNRATVMARDGYTCQYCGFAPRSEQGTPLGRELTIDHVVPRARATNSQVRLPWSNKLVGLTSWENVVACCRACNQRKADRLPAEAGMQLRAMPRRPATWEAVPMLAARTTIPEQWKEYLPSAA